MKYTTLLLVLVVSCSLWAQKTNQKPDEVVNAFKMHQNLETVQILNHSELKSQSNLPSILEEYEIFQLDLEQINDLFTQRTQGLVMELSYGDEILDLELIQKDLYSPGFTVTEMPSGRVVDLSSLDRGLHYQGVIAGKKGSIVALSVFRNEISAVMSWPGSNGNMVLGKLENSEDHILYRDTQIASEFEMVCDTESGDDVIAHEENITAQQRLTVRCTDIHFDVSNQIYNNKGGTAGATNYMTSLFNQVQIIYANDNIGILLGGITVWSSPEPFSDLNGFSSYRTSNTVPADLNAYINYAYGGGVAYLNALCSNVRFSVSGIESSFNNVPTYSWSVMVVSHELGHNMGSQHTHACAWNGNNTAIDGCGPNSGYSEGCSGSNPPAGGTIMSYCHLTAVGINFSQGFGPQPAARIAAYVDGSACVAPCEEPTCDDGYQNGNETGVDCGGSCPNICPTCVDGFQNGDETGVDCGGSSCAPCPCLGDDVTLTIVLDNYPEETTWTITDAGGGIVGSGGPYGTQPDGSTVVESICVNSACYTLNFFDSFGDGICCAVGTGSYVLTDMVGTVLASGGAFTTSESTPFCIDGSAVCQSPTALDAVEIGFGTANPRVNGTWVNPEGTTNCEVRGGRISASSYLAGEPEFTNVANTQVITQTNGSTVNFNIALYNNPNIPFIVGQRYGYDVRCACADGSGFSAWANITPQATFVVPAPPPGVEVGEGNKLLNAGIEVMNIFPNPAEDIVNIEIQMLEEGSVEVQLINALGQMVLQDRSNGKTTMNRLEVSDLDPGIYMVRVRTVSGVITERLIVK